jgi:hypothetical protein
VTPSKSSDPVLKRRSPTRPPPLSRDIDGFTVHRGFVLRGKKTTNRNRKTRATALLGRNHGERPVIVVYSCRWASPHNCKARFLGQRRRAVRGELATAFTDVVEPLPPPPGGCAAGDTQIVLVHHNSTGLAAAVVHGSLSLCRWLLAMHVARTMFDEMPGACTFVCKDVEGTGAAYRADTERSSCSRHPWTRGVICR